MKIMFGNKGLDVGRLGDAGSPASRQFLQANGSKIQGIFAVDGGSHRPLGTSLQKYNLVGKVASRRLRPEAADPGRRQGRQLDFTIDQSPYLQGFLPVMYLYLFQLSGGLVSPPTTDTGLNFVVKDNVDPYMRDHDPVRGLDEGAEVHQAHRPDLRLTGCGTLEIAGPRRFTVAASHGESPRRLGMTRNTGIGRRAGLG